MTKLEDRDEDYYLGLICSDYPDASLRLNARLNELKNRNEKLEKVARVAQSALSVWDHGMEVQPGSAIDRCMKDAIAELEKP